MTSKTSPLALLVQAETMYGVQHVRAYVVVPQPDGQLLNPSWGSRWDGTDAHRFEGFRVTAYVGFSMSDNDTERGRVWGAGYEYADVHIGSAEHAAVVASVMRTAERGLSKITLTEGDVSEADEFFALVVRLARVFKIPAMYVRNTLKRAVTSGERFRKVDGPDLQSYLAHVGDLAREGRYAEATT